MKKPLWTLIATGLLASLSPAAFAAPQDTPAEITFSDAEFGNMAKLLTGTWKATGVKTGDATADILLSIAPVSMKGVPDTLYCEVARAEAVDAPYRQTILQFRKEDGKTVLRTYEFNTPNGEVHCLRTMWATPDAFPAEITVEKLTPTTDAVVTAGAAQFRAVSAKPADSNKNGAATVTSELEVSTASLKIADRGLAADGSIVWGPATGEWTTFERAGAGVSVTRLGEGLIVVNYPSPNMQNKVPVNDDVIVTHYIGSLGDGTIFDTSYQRGSPYRYANDGPMLAGWKRAMGDARIGMKRKLIIPGPMGWGENGHARNGIGPNATLYFQLQILDIQPQPKKESLPPIEIKPDEPGTAKPQDAKNQDAKTQGMTKEEVEHLKSHPH